MALPVTHEARGGGHAAILPAVVAGRRPP